MCNPYENSKEYFKAEMKVISSEERALELICSRRQWGAIVFTEQGPEWKYNGGTRSLTQIMGQSYIMPFFKITMNMWPASSCWGKFIEHGFMKSELHR